MNIHEEFVHLTSSHSDVSVTPKYQSVRGVVGGDYTVRLARHDELDQVFRLRYEVFYRELGAADSVSLREGLDFDVYDSLCDHLVAIHKDTIVGTCRILPVVRALEKNLPPYCSTEFDVEPLIQTFGDGLIELGRTCVAKEHRNGVVPRLLWKFLLRYILQQNASAIMGCVSIHALNDVQAINVREQLVADDMWHLRWNLATKMPAQERLYGLYSPSDCSRRVELPPLMKAYAGLGAKVCAGPAMDREFGCADYLMLAEVAKIPERYLRLFLS